MLKIPDFLQLESFHLNMKTVQAVTAAAFCFTKKSPQERRAKLAVQGSERKWIVDHLFDYYN